MSRTRKEGGSMPGEMSYGEWLEGLVALANFRQSNPYLQFHVRVDTFLKDEFLPKAYKVKIQKSNRIARRLLRLANAAHAFQKGDLRSPKKGSRASKYDAQSDGTSDADEVSTPRSRRRRNNATRKRVIHDMRAQPSSAAHGGSDSVATGGDGAGVGAGASAEASPRAHGQPDEGMLMMEVLGDLAPGAGDDGGGVVVEEAVETFDTSLANEFQ